MSNHQQQELRYKGRTIGVDVVLLPALKALWKAGIKTDGCCQGNAWDGRSGDNAYIGFVDSQDARVFHKRMDAEGEYLDQISGNDFAGEWHLSPKIYGRLAIYLEWCPTKTEYLVDLICKVFKEKKEKHNA